MIQLGSIRGVSKGITNKLGAPLTDSDFRLDGIDAETPTYEVYEDDETPPDRLPEADDITLEDADYYIGAEVSLPIGGMLLGGTVKRCAHDVNGNVTGKADKNPILDSRTYEVKFEHGWTMEFSATAIAEHMFTQCDLEGNQYLLLDSIIDHKIEGSAMKESNHYVIVNGQKHHRKTMTGIKVCAHWKDGTMSWERMVDIKQSYPLELACEYLPHSLGVKAKGS